MKMPFKTNRSCRCLFPRHHETITLRLITTLLAGLILAVSSIFQPSAPAQTATPPPASGVFRAGRILVKPRAGVDLSPLHQLTGATVLRTFPAIGNLQILQIPAGSLVSDLVSTYLLSGLVEYAEADYLVHALKTPNDFRFSDGSLWDLQNTGQFNGKPGADIDAVNGWDIEYTATNIIIAVVDTGARYTHEDLAANMWVNPSPGGDGFTNDIHGINTVANSGDPNDDHGHGTHVSGTIGALGNNTVGVVGVAWATQLMACKFLDSTGNGSTSDAITCIDYARQHGAKIINASWGTTNFNSSALRDAIVSARDADIIFVAAAGNSAEDNSVNPIYPASFDVDNIISVAATTRTDDLAQFSNYGATNVHLGAPGSPIFSCWNGSDSDYRYDDGTSMAAALVSGVCALVRTHYPNDDYQQAIHRVLAGTDPLPSLSGKCVTGGRLNLYKALSVNIASFTANPGSGSAPLTIQYTDQSTGSVTNWDWDFGDGSAHGSVQNPSHTFGSAGDFTTTLTVSGTVGSSSATVTIHVTNAPPTASFTANPTSGQAPLTVQFTDQSTGSITNRNWNFGDGTSHNSTQNPSHTFNSAGTFTTTLTVTGPGGSSTSSATIQVTPAGPPPVVTIVATKPVASDAGPIPGCFTVCRNGSAALPLTVRYSIGGTAINGVDYQTLSGTVVIPAGATAAAIQVVPIDDQMLELTEAVVLTLTPEPAYQVGTQNAATVLILDANLLPGL